MGASVRFAVIADSHANAFALAEVLADTARRGVDYIVNLGDNANGPIDPVRTLALLRAQPMIQVRGNGDRMTADETDVRSASARFARERLDAEVRRWLRELPLTVSRDGWLACHGSPTSDTEYLVEAVTPMGAQPRPVDDVADRLRDVDASLVLCGHTHLPRSVRLSDGRVVVNPGSVGLPAYDDAEPFPHRMEAGSPDARYAVVSGRPWDWEIEFVALAYDWRAAGAAARAAGWPEWARAVETGRC